MRSVSKFAASLTCGLAAAILPVSVHARGPAHEGRAGHAPETEAGDADTIVVAAHPPTDYAIMAGTTTLEGDRLTAHVRGQIGDTLARLPGVSATSFAPGASRPVLRGFDGDRVRVLLDGIGSIDASSVSADHAVVFDALTVDHVDILHGPAVLLYGGQAIGGAVNALDKRIPRSVPEAITGTAMAGYASAARERSASGAVDIPLANRLVGHFDASWRKSGNLRTGGHINSRPLRAELLAEATEHQAAGEIEEADELREIAGLSGKLPGSAARSLTLGAGLAFIDAGGNLGVSVQRFDTRYGVPLRPGAGHGHAGEEEGGHEGDAAVAIDLVQTRIDLRGAIELGGMFDNLQFRGAWGDYRHVELEGGEPGTRFDGKGIEFRADLVQARRGGWRGHSGVHVFSRKLALTGPEAIVPDNQLDRFGIFTLQSLELGGGFEIEGAGRYERASVKAREAGFQRNYDLWSAAVGLSYAPAPEWKIGASYIHGARAPSPEELLSDGLHVATQAYELGDPGFGVEKSDGVEAYVRYRTPRAEFSLTAYYTRFGRFIAALPTGEEREGFPVFRYAQLPARYRGFEATGSIEAMRWNGGGLRIEASGDYTRASLKQAGPVPRIPPLRLMGGVEIRQDALRLRADVEWNKSQHRVAAFENPVPGFTLVNFSADWHPMGEDGPLALILSLDNALDVVGRRAASVTRDFVPISGRDLRFTAKFTF